MLGAYSGKVKTFCHPAMLVELFSYGQAASTLSSRALDKDVYAAFFSRFFAQWI